MIGCSPTFSLDGQVPFAAFAGKRLIPHTIAELRLDVARVAIFHANWEIPINAVFNVGVVADATFFKLFSNLAGRIDF